MRTPILYLVERGAYMFFTDKEERPAVLVSFYYKDDFFKQRPKSYYRHWVMDSGGFSADSLGKEINLDEYIQFCLEMMATDDELHEIFCLDKIGDWKVTTRNCEKMWKAGVPATPVFHAGEPWDVLKGYAKDYPKISLGGMVPLPPKKKLHFVEQSFARVYPKPIHGLGIGTASLLMQVPWHSVDVSSWVMPARVGAWQAFDGANLHLRAFYNLKAEIRHFLEIERAAQTRWASEMAQFDHLSLLLPLARQRVLKQNEEGKTNDIEQRFHGTAK